jgi:hypothetical protein
VLAVFLALSAAQIVVKVRDWNWAGRLTADGARLVDEALAPACGDGHVLFLTAPVGIRGVYTHFYYETFALTRGCMPATFQILARVVRLDTAVQVRWDGPSTIVMTVPEYRENLVVSEDLRHFDIPVRSASPLAITTPLGLLRSEHFTGTQRLTLTLRPGMEPEQLRIFYYSAGRLQLMQSRPGG